MVDAVRRYRGPGDRPRRARAGDGRTCTRPRSPPRSCARRSASTASRSWTSSSTTRSTSTRRRRRSFGRTRLGQPLMRELERFVILQVVDTRWREHLENMDYLREGVHLRAMAQKDPLVEYTSRGPLDVRGAERGDPRGGRVHALPRGARPRGGRAARDAGRPAGTAPRSSTSTSRSPVRTRSPRPGWPAASSAARSRLRRDDGSGGGRSVITGQRVVAEKEKVGRNDPCWCGSGKKFKKCHGA